MYNLLFVKFILEEYEMVSYVIRSFITFTGRLFLRIATSERAYSVHHANHFLAVSQGELAIC